MMSSRDRLYRRRNKGSTIDAERRIAIAREEERLFHFDTFTPDDAYSLGHYIRKRFQVDLNHAPSTRPPSSMAGSVLNAGPPQFYGAASSSSSSRMYSHYNASTSTLGQSSTTSVDQAKDRSSIIISIMTPQEVPLYAGTIGADTDVVGPRGWGLLEAVSRAVRRTGHSSYYLKAALDSSRETMTSMGMDRPYKTPPHMLGGVFPVYLNSDPSEPVAVIGVYGGSFTEDHDFIVSALRRFHQRHLNASKENLAEVPPKKRLRPVRSVTFSVDTAN